MDKRYLVAGLAVAVVAAGSFTLGRLQTPPAPPPAVPVAQTSVPPGHPPAGAPQVPLREYDHFRVGNRNIKAMVADGDTMWIGTSGGVIRYDIPTDSHILYDNKTGLLSNGVFHLSRFGNDLWVGTYGGGLSVLDLTTNTWREYNVPNGMGDAFVYDVLHTKAGDTWVATWSGANRIRGNQMDDMEAWDLYTVANTEKGLPNDWVYGLAEGKNGEIWMATEGGVARFVDGQWTRWTHAEGLGANFEIVKTQVSLNSDPGTQSRHHAQQKKEQGLEDVSVAYNPNYVISIAVDDDGSVWAGTWGGGLSHFDGKQWKTMTMADGLPSNHIFMLKKKDGVLWVGTNRGLAKYDGKGFTTFGVSDGLFSESVFSMAFGKDNSTWVGSFGGVARFRKAL
ncbi:MAG: regulator [Rhodospirillaceae bacterium]|nr:regulator [Rhodospirillales bacterium]